MQLLFIGCEYSGTTTLSRKLDEWLVETIGDQDKGIIDDLPYAKRASKHLNVSLDVVTIDSHRMANDLESMVIQLDEPLADPAALNVLYIRQPLKFIF